MIHVRAFETHEDYEEFLNSGDMKYPNLSVCEQPYEVHYNDNGHIDKVSISDINNNIDDGE